MHLRTVRGTANQDFGYAYNANLCVRLLASDGVNVNSEYKPEDDEQYLDMVRYKYGEMVDGEKWFSTENGLGLRGRSITWRQVSRVRSIMPIQSELQRQRTL